jgi:hypothetical protein
MDGLLGGIESRDTLGFLKVSGSFVDFNKRKGPKVESNGSVKSKKVLKARQGKAFRPYTTYIGHEYTLSSAA